MKLDIIAFDADDTLWENEGFYRRATEQFIAIFSHYQDEEQANQTLDAIERHNVGIYGYGIKSFALSMIEAAITVSSGQASGSEIAQIIQIIKDMLEARVELFEHSEATLARLAEQYDLMLITKGDQFEQERKIQRTGLVKYFRYVEIIGDKSPETYRLLLRKYNLDPTRILMVGNSIRSDILPVLAIGGRAVYIPYEHTWSHEMEIGEQDGDVVYDSLENLGQLVDFISQLEE
jgi:putative hydrolase of the HAD superfamily